MIDALKTYVADLGVDDVFYLSKMIDAVQKVAGVVDVLIEEVTMDGVTYTRKIDEVPAGYFKLSPPHTITYVVS